MDTCEHCKWWSGYVDKVELNGRKSPMATFACKRRAPVGHITYRLGNADQYVAAGWPQTLADDFCGDFERKEPKGEQG